MASPPASPVRTNANKRRRLTEPYLRELASRGGVRNVFLGTSPDWDAKVQSWTAFSEVQRCLRGACGHAPAADPACAAADLNGLLGDSVGGNAPVSAELRRRVALEQLEAPVRESLDGAVDAALGVTRRNLFDYFDNLEVHNCCAPARPARKRSFGALTQVNT